MFFISMTDRILFWIDSDLTYFGLAYYLQKKIDAKFSGIIDITNKIVETLNKKLPSIKIE